MSKKYFLVISCKMDSHADHIIGKLNSAGLGKSVIRLNTEDLVTNTKISFDGVQANVHIIDSDRKFSTNEIGCVWYRRPEQPKLPKDFLPAASAYTMSQISGVLNGLYYLTSDSATWINPRPTANLSNNKLKQLQVASQMGFDVPATLITNDKDDAQRFFEGHQNVCIKSTDASNPSIGENEEQPFFTIRLTEDEKESSLSLIKNCPTFFQEFIDKAFDLRVSVIGKQIFAAEIHSQEFQESRQDFRLVSPTLLKHKEHVVPQKLQELILRFMNYYDLNFSALDFAVTRDNKYVFLENNPNGQWAWVEHLTGLPISEGFLRFITDNIETDTN